MRKVLGDDVMNFATSSTDVDELNAITQETHTSNPALIQPYNTDPWLAGLRTTNDKQGSARSCSRKQRCGQMRKARQNLPR